MEPNLPWRSLGFMKSHALASRDGTLHAVANRSLPQSQIVFLHGVLRNWKSFYPLYPEFERRSLPVAALDFRGHGDSARVPGKYFVKDYVDDALALLAAMEGPVVLYGHSLGAMVALAAASKMPDRVRHLFLEDPPFATMGERLPGTSLHRYFLGVEHCVLQNQTASSERLFEAFSEIVVAEPENGPVIRVRDQRDVVSRRFSASCLEQVAPEVLGPINSGRWLEGTDWKAWAHGVRCPVHIFQADSQMGGMLTDSDLQVLLDGRSGLTTHQRFERAGHSLHWQQSQQVLAPLFLLFTQTARLC